CSSSARRFSSALRFASASAARFSASAFWRAISSSRRFCSSCLRRSCSRSFSISCSTLALSTVTASRTFTFACGCTAISGEKSMLTTSKAPTTTCRMTESQKARRVLRETLMVRRLLLHRLRHEPDALDAGALQERHEMHDLSVRDAAVALHVHGARLAVLFRGVAPQGGHPVDEDFRGNRVILVLAEVDVEVPVPVHADHHRLLVVRRHGLR